MLVELVLNEYNLEEVASIKYLACIYWLGNVLTSQLRSHAFIKKVLSCDTKLIIHRSIFRPTQSCRVTETGVDTNVLRMITGIRCRRAVGQPHWKWGHKTDAGCRWWWWWANQRRSTGRRHKSELATSTQQSRTYYVLYNSPSTVFSRETKNQFSGKSNKKNENRWRKGTNGMPFAQSVWISLEKMRENFVFFLGQLPIAETTINECDHTYSLPINIGKPANMCQLTQKMINMHKW